MAMMIVRDLVRIRASGIAMVVRPYVSRWLGYAPILSSNPMFASGPNDAPPSSTGGSRDAMLDAKRVDLF